MINKQKLWFLTLFSIILVLSVYYIAMPSDTLSNLITKETVTSDTSKVSISEEDTLSALRVADDEEVLAQMDELQTALLDEKTNAEDKSNAYERLVSINLNKGKENALETIILNTYKLKSFIKIKDDQIKVTISSKDNSFESANNIIRTIQKEYTDKKYITVKYQ